MINGNAVKPRKWKNILELYDDGKYSAIWGWFKDENREVLWIRWNGDLDIGYPKQGKNPLWFVMPDFLTRIILNELKTKVIQNNQLGNLSNLATAIAAVP